MAQGNEVIKHFTKQGEILAGKILLFNVQTMQSRIIKTAIATKTNVTVLTETPSTSVISAKDLKKIIDTDKYELIDVRSLEEHNSFNIGGKNIPLNEIEKKYYAIDLQKSIVMYCATGKRSDEAVNFFANKFPGSKVFSLEGGLEAWKEEV